MPTFHMYPFIKIAISHFPAGLLNVVPNKARRELKANVEYWAFDHGVFDTLIKNGKSTSN